MHHFSFGGMRTPGFKQTSVTPAFVKQRSVNFSKKSIIMFKPASVLRFQPLNPVTIRQLSFSSLTAGQAFWKKSLLTKPLFHHLLAARFFSTDKSSDDSSTGGASGNSRGNGSNGTVLLNELNGIYKDLLKTPAALFTKVDPFQDKVTKILSANRKNTDAMLCCFQLLKLRSQTGPAARYLELADYLAGVFSHSGALVSRILADKAYYLLKADRFAEVIPVCTTALENPSVEDEVKKAVLTYRGVAFNSLKKPQEALNDFNRTLSMDPDYALALRNRLVVFAEQELFEEMLADAERLVKVAPDSFESHFFCAQALHELERFADAAKHYGLALGLIKTPEEELRVLVRQIECLNDLGSYRAALSQCERALRLDPSHKEILAEQRRAQGKLSRKDPVMPSSPEKESTGRMSKLMQLKDYQKAIDAGTEALRREPENATVYYLRSQAHYDAYKEDKSRVANQQDGPIPAELKRHYHAALSDIRRAMELQPKNVFFIDRYAWFLLDTGRYDSALQVINSALEIDPDHAQALWRKGIILEALHRYDEALEYYDKAIEKKPAAAVYHSRGIVLIGLGRHGDALESFDMALALAPELQTTLCSKAQVLDDLHRYEEAIAIYDRLIREDYLTPFCKHRRAFSVEKLKERKTGLPEESPSAPPRSGNGKKELTEYNVVSDGSNRIYIPPELIKTLEKQLRSTPDDLTLLHSLVHFTGVSGRHDSALNYAKRLYELTGEPEWLSKMGALYETLERYPDALSCYDALLSFPEEHSNALSMRGAILFKMGRPDEAWDSITRALEGAPEDVRALLIQSTILIGRKKFEEALALIGKLEKKELAPSDREKLFNNAGVCLMKLSRFEEAVIYLKKALEILPSERDILSNLITAFNALNRHEESLSCLRQLQALQPDNPALLSETGDTLLRLDRTEDALDAFKKALSLRPEAEALLFKLGNTLLALQRDGEALVYIDRLLEKNPYHLNGILLKIMISGGAKRYTDALNLIDLLLSKDPEKLGSEGIFPAHLHWLKTQTLIELKKYAEALKSIDAALSLAPEDRNFLIMKSGILMELKAFAEAARYCREALLRYPEDVSLLGNLGNALRETGHYTEARKVFEKALAIAPQQPNLLSAMGTLFTVTGHFDRALHYVNRALTAAPKDIRILNNKVSLLDKMGLYEDGLRECDAVLAQDPDNVPALNNKGWLLFRSGNPEEAIPFFKHALRLMPEDLLLHINYARALGQVNSPNDTLIRYNELLKHHPGNVQLLSNKAAVFLKLNRFQECIETCNEALKTDPECFAALQNQVSAFRELNLIPEARHAAEKNLNLQKKHFQNENDMAYEDMKNVILAANTYIFLCFKLGKIKNAEREMAEFKTRLPRLHPALTPADLAQYALFQQLIDLIKNARQNPDNTALVAEIKTFLITTMTMDLSVTELLSDGSVRSAAAPSVTFDGIFGKYNDCGHILSSIAMGFGEKHGQLGTHPREQVNGYIALLETNLSHALDKAKRYSTETHAILKEAIYKEWVRHDDRILSNLDRITRYLHGLPKALWLTEIIGRMAMLKVRLRALIVLREKIVEGKHTTRSDDPFYKAAFKAAEPRLRARFDETLTAMRAHQESKGVFPTCFISYAWGSPQSEQWVRKQLAADLMKVVGEQRVLLDVKDNRGGKDVPAFVNRILDPATCLIFIVATKEIVRKYDGQAASYVKDELKNANFVLHQNPNDLRVVFLLRDEMHEAVPDFGQRLVPYHFAAPEAYFVTFLNMVAETVLPDYRINREMQEVEVCADEALVRMVREFEEIQEEIM